MHLAGTSTSRKPSVAARASESDAAIAGKRNHGRNQGMVSSFNGVLSLMVTAIKGTYASNDKEDADNDGNGTPILTPLAYGVFRSSIVVVLSLFL